MRPIAFLATLGLSATALAADLYVDGASGSDANDCTGPTTSACSTLQGALSKGPMAPDAIHVAAGTYASTATAYQQWIPPGVDLVGAGAETTLFVPAPGKGGFFLLDPTGNTLSGFTVKSADGPGIQAVLSAASTGSIALSDVASNENTGGGLNLGGGGGNFTATIGACEFVDNQAPGIYAYTPGGLLDLSVVGSTITGNSAPGLAATVNASTATQASGLTLRIDQSEFVGNAAGIWSWAHLAPIDVTLSGNAISGSGGHGVSVSGSTTQSAAALDAPSFTLRMTDNQITGHQGSGVNAWSNNGWGSVYLDGNTLDGNQNGGFYAWQSANTGFGQANIEIAFVDNKMRSNGSNGLLLGATRARVYADLTGNVLTGNTGNGVDGYFSSWSSSPWTQPTELTVQVNLRDNEIGGNDAHGATLLGYWGWTELSLSGNTLVGNGGNGVNISGSNGVESVTLVDNTLDGDGKGAVGVNVQGGYHLDRTFSLSGGSVTGFNGPGLTLQGSSGALDFEIVGPHIHDNGYSGIELWANYGSAPVEWTVRDAVIEDNGRYGIFAHISYADVDALTLQGNQLKRNQDAGIHVYMSTSAFVSDLDISDNTLNEPNDGVDGVRLEFNHSRVSGTVSGNTITDASGKGMEILAWSSDVVDLKVAGNTITGSGDGGLWAGTGREGQGGGWRSSLFAEITGNTLTENQRYGLALGAVGSSGAIWTRVAGNDISDNEGSGVRFHGENWRTYLTADLQGNLITNNHEDGLWFDAFTDTTASLNVDLRHNTIKNNADGYAAASTYGDVFFSGNTAHDVTAYDNWWGSTSPVLIGSHIWDNLDDSTLATLHFSALFPVLEFELSSWSAPVVGGTHVVITPLPDAPPFVDDIAGHPLQVHFGEVACTEMELVDGVIYALVPPGAAGLVDVTVTNPAGHSGTLEQAFEYAEVFVDSDDDGVEDGTDNCMDTPNTDQVDHDLDGDGDLCDDDDDDDDVLDGADNCPTVPNPDQDDLDGDLGGDACDDDDDGDGVADLDDNCPNLANFLQTDTDEDGLGDACDLDADGDGILDADASRDSDGDGVSDDSDNCPGIPNEDQADADDDGIGDACDIDADGDGVPDADEAPPTDTDRDGFDDSEDNCPNVANEDQADQDSDGVGDACDIDANGNGIVDADEKAEPEEGGCGCATGDAPMGLLPLLPLLVAVRRRRVS
ncbi:MAG: thrombospondin type 3 repeat-containing protein [Deltaproteobacteria bacterium]|nr:thrombospondin type 3 repeat-containing protein [Deltaproteobacteria bacterium]